MSEASLGIPRVAAFLLSLEADAAKQVIGHLAPDVVEEVAQAMLELPPEFSQPGKVEELHRELAKTANAPKVIRPVKPQQLGVLLAKALGDARGNELLDKIRERRLQERPFSEIEAADPTALGTVLAKESPTIASLVIAHLEPSFSASVLGAFEHFDALEVIRRMATLSPPSYTVLRSIAEQLAERLEGMTTSAAPLDEAARLQTIAELLSNSDATMEKEVIDAIQDDDADMAQEIREFMFTWEDIGTIDKRSMQKILGSVDTKTLSLGLKGASEAVEENVMGNLSQRVRDMVKEERELIGAVPLDEVLAGRDEIMRSVRALIESGEFRPSRGGEELVE